MKNTVEDQAQIFMDKIQSRRRGPAKTKTLAAYRSYISNWISPLLGRKSLQDVENGTLKAFIVEISPKLAPTTVTAVVSLVKAIVASAVDTNGNQLYPRTWNNDFIDLPLVKKTDLDAPIIGGEALQRALGRSQGLDKALYVLLAGSGLRIGEAMALEGRDTGSNSYWDRETGIVHVKTTLVPGGIQSSPKTDAGVRQVDLAPELNRYLVASLGDGAGNTGRIFPGTVQTAYNHLQRVGVNTGFHAFRRFRRTHLETKSVPGGFVRYWMGHADRDVDDSYIKIENDIPARKQWAEKAGLGFQIP